MKDRDKQWFKLETVTMLKLFTQHVSALCDVKLGKMNGVSRYEEAALI